ncbi:hypothetical protein CC86DRAFT_408850 [Ophiobolus disseminans]|uniref:DUF1446-domain-containing protein n=1 Tax=Ophiobolus disseminans TaxID=1469910 RepID=A0A6A6ZRW5_9PLEO|nr:hypothetical protein CC86DRAFT_408850 [Ophiobolus disseminans]
MTPVGMLGYGLNSQHTATALQHTLRLHPSVPVTLILDSGSTDSGPEKLALGCMSVPREAYKRDLRKLMALGREYGVPVVFSSAGGDGSDEHVREMGMVVREIAGETDSTPKILSIFSSVPKSLVSDRLQSGMISPCSASVPALTPRAIAATPRILAQIGPEPFLDAMHAHPDFNILIAGRAYDPAPYIAWAAFASRTSLSDKSSPEVKKLWGGFAHMGKILECGGLCGVPKSNGAMATMYADGTFDVTPLDPGSMCTPISVAAHTLYEKARPDVLYGPGGYLDLTGMKTEALEDGRSVRVSGGVFNFSGDDGSPYTVKLEGAEVVGYRAQMMGSFRDPILIGQLDSYLERVKGYVALQHEDMEGTWELGFHVYGQHQVSSRSSDTGQPSEVFIIGEALASTQQMATNVACMARIAATHGPYPGQKATSGNFAYGLGGQMETELGPCAQFSIYHLMQLEEGEERLKLNDLSVGLFRCEFVSTSASTSESPIVRSPLLGGSEKTVGREDIAKHAISSPQKLCLDPKTLGDIAKLIRSKNAGPYEVTLDVMFDSEAEYQLVKAANLLNIASMAKLFNIREESIIWEGFFDQAWAYKVTIPRLRNGKPTASGGYMENDVHASQQYIGFINLALPEGVVEDWSRLQQSGDRVNSRT